MYTNSHLELHVSNTCILFLDVVDPMNQPAMLTT